jgi:hypothetical protein
MFEKLLSLLLHAKGGAVATVFVLGTTGALVTATVDNGLTTITITEQSATTTGSETTTGGSTTTNTTVTEAILALFNRTSAEEDPTSTATGKGCSDEAHERNEQMKRVNAASNDAREDVRALGKDAGKSADAKELVRDADTEIKDLRQAAVKDIHATFDCDKDDEDEDEDEDQDEDETSTGTSSGTTSTTTTTTTVALNSDDAEAIADKAIEDMEKVVEDLEAALEGLEDEDEDDSDESETTSNEKQNGKSDKAKNENKGKGNGKGRG